MDRFFYLIIRLVGTTPLPLRAALGRALGRIFALIPTREKSIAIAQLQKALPEVPAAKTSNEVYAELGQMILESLNLQPILTQLESKIRCERWDIAETVLSSGKGVLCLTGHVGNWDLLGAWAAARGVDLLTVGREARNKTLHKVLQRLRMRAGIKTIWRSNRSGLRTILAHLDRGAVVAALIDQDTRVQSEFAPFFGIPARTPSALVSLARERGYLIVAAFLRREPNLQYVVDLSLLDNSRSTVEILSQYHSCLEDTIRRAPSQWVWFHKRWRSQPDGSSLRTSEYLKYLAVK